MTREPVAHWQRPTTALSRMRDHAVIERADREDALVLRLHTLWVRAITEFKESRVQGH